MVMLSNYRLDDLWRYQRGGAGVDLQTTRSRFVQIDLYKYFEGTKWEYNPWGQALSELRMMKDPFKRTWTREWVNRVWKGTPLGPVRQLGLVLLAHEEEVEEK